MSRDPFTTDASIKQWKAWEKRAETINKKAMELLSDMMSALGPEHEATDFADNIIHAAENLLGWCDRGKSNGDTHVKK
jgi:hypothetical protein